jgi:CubicO group peptidase (beta-lactamase class C family)
MGALVLGDGVWNGTRILPEGWVRRMLAPSPQNPRYGLLWWLNGGAAPRFPSAPADSVFALGAGGHVIWIARSLALVAVLRWIDTAHIDGLIARIMAALREPAAHNHETGGAV